MRFSIQTDISDVMKAFKKNFKNNPKIFRKAMKGSLNLGKQEAKSQSYRNVKRHTGTLRKSFVSKSTSLTSGYIVNRSSYAGTLEHGGKRVAKGKYMTFMTDDGWVKVPSYTVKAQLGFIKTMEALFNSEKPIRNIQRILEREIGKIYD